MAIRNARNKPSDLFERRVQRIHELIEGFDSYVTWDDRIPDPDNPDVTRQIDVTVRTRDQLMLIECRLSKRPQDVKWIEELIGRKKSLGANAIIGVCSNGFTKGARLKATAQGVVLRHLQNLRDDEVASWDQAIKLNVYFLHYTDVHIGLGFKAVVEHNFTDLNRDPGLGRVFQTTFNEVARYLSSKKIFPDSIDRLLSFGLRFRPASLVLCGAQLDEIVIEGKVRLTTRQLARPKSFIYKEPNQPESDRKALLEKFDVGETQVVHVNDQVSVLVDLEAIDLPPLSQVRYISTKSDVELDHAIFALQGSEKLNVTDGPVDLSVYEVSR